MCCYAQAVAAWAQASCQGARRPICDVASCDFAALAHGRHGGVGLVAVLADDRMFDRAVFTPGLRRGQHLRRSVAAFSVTRDGRRVRMAPNQMIGSRSSRGLANLLKVANGVPRPSRRSLGAGSLPKSGSVQGCRIRRPCGARPWPPWRRWPGRGAWRWPHA